VVLEPRDFQAWLAGGTGAEAVTSAGERLFRAQGCPSCHAGGAEARGPVLAGLFGTRVALAGGGSAVADEAYLREAILQPQARVVAGFEPVMPTYQGLLSEEDVMQLIAYLKTLERP
jgi:cytochrome c oxidase subunit 2